jgi:hypothetical protein
MGAVKPGCPWLGPNIRATTGTVGYSETIHQRDRQDGRHADVKSLKNCTIRQIARFSHTKDKAAVLAYLDAGFNVTGPAALDIPLVVRQLISKAITHFMNIPKK